ncbi:hypothetical protein, conserved [Leishmania tarentolae]|uniref:Mitochondrial import inner membrane translocase subunit TIM50 n=1 Tax=Leishmania tarentolae TaxID=5689 RepID=A0A640KPP4_LEITA|nr:hypothetical protein, conserved [Leishmania tarentolae]
MADGPPRFFTKPEEYVGVNKHRRTLFLDMDETLVHCYFEKPTFFIDTNEDFFQFTLEDDPSVTYYAFRRPGLNEFLYQCAEHYDMRIFTAGEDLYARTLLRWLLPDNLIDESRWYTRDACVGDGYGRLIKNLSMLDGFQFEERTALILDDSAPDNVYPHQNALAIPRFAPQTGRTDEENYGRMQADRGLEMFGRMLCGEHFTRCDDVRVPIARFYALIGTYTRNNTAKSEM